MAAEDAAVTVTLRANLKDYEAALKSAVRATERAAKAAEQAVSGIGKKAQAAPIAQAFQKSAGQMASDARILQYQLNDIFSGVASGQGIRAVQMQLGQIAQQLGGQGLKSAARTMGSAMLSMVNPINLAVVAFGVLATVAASYFTSSEDEAKDLTKALDEQLRVINKLRESQGLKPVDQSQSDVARFVAMREAMAEGVKIAGELTEKLGEITNAILDVPKDAFGGQTATILELDAALRKLQESARTKEDVFEFAQALQEIEKRKNLPDDIQALVREVIDLASRAALSAQNLQALRDAMDGVSKAEQRASESLKRFNDNLAEMGKIAKGQVSDTQQLLNLYMQIIGQARTMGQVMAANEAFVAGTERAVLAGSGAELIKKEEGFRASPYADPDDLAIGFGMHQYIDDAGRVIDITNEMTTTVAEANEQLARQIPRYQAQIIKAIGADTWAGLAENQQAALTSIAWNYGHLPDSVAEAIRRGDHGQAAVAIRNLSANPERRGREAALYASGSAKAGDALDVADEAARAAEKEAEARARATENLTEYLAKLDEQATLEQRIAEIKMSGMSAEDQARAIAVETELQTALNLAKENGRVLTEAEIEQVRRLALTKTEAKIAGDAYVQSQKDSADAMKQFNQAIAGMAQSAISGLVNDLRNGVDAGEAFNNMLNRILDSLIQMSLQAIFNPAGGGGILGMLFPGAQTGGIVGKTAFSQRKVSPMVFAGAQRYATGGMVGLRSGEVPIIAHRGEMIIPKNMVGRMGTPAGGDTHITDNSRIRIDMGTGIVAADTASAKEFGDNVKKIIQQEMVRESRPGGLLRRV